MLYGLVGLILIAVAFMSIVLVVYVVLREEPHNISGQGYVRSPRANEPLPPADSASDAEPPAEQA